MKNIIELRDELAAVFKEVRTGKTSHSRAAELSNLAGKIVSSIKAELMYAAQREEKPEIKFMNKREP